MSDPSQSSKASGHGHVTFADAALQEPLLSQSSKDLLSRSTGTPKKRLARSISSPSCESADRCPPSVAKSVDLLPFNQKQETSTILTTALVALLMYLAAGILLFYFTSSNLEGHKTGSNMVDALYFCIVTMTTVGYGDIVPNSTPAKFFTCVYLFLGFGLVGILLSSAANYLVMKQEGYLIHAITKEESPVKEAFAKVILTGFLVLGILATGLLVLMTVEEKSLIDAVYFVCVTVTTLGYGDQTFQTWQGRLFGSAWILLSTLFVAQFFLALAEMMTESRHEAMAKYVLTRKTTISDLEAADFDHDGKVRSFEFVLFKLKELGKIEEEDITRILREFKELDRDNSGTISISDIMAQ